MMMAAANGANNNHSSNSNNFPPITTTPGRASNNKQHDNNNQHGGGAHHKVEAHRKRDPTQQEIFEMQIARFYDYIDHVTLRNSELELTSEQKRQHLQEHTPFDRFRDALYDIFGDEIKFENIKPLYRKIANNPDATVDWSEVFGYGGQVEDVAQWRAEEAREKHGEDVVDDGKVIVTKLRRQVADAAGGGSKRRDIVKQIVHVQQADNYVVTSQHGLVQVLSCGKYQTVGVMQVQPGDQLTVGTCYLPNLRRLAIATDRQLCIWDYRSPSRECFVISPFPANLLCLAAVTLEGPENNQFEDQVLFGDVEGCVGVVRIHQKDLSVKSPHKKATAEERSSESGPGGNKKDAGLGPGVVHLIDTGTLSTPIVRRKVHTDWTVKVVYCPDLRLFGSCSPNSKTSFIAEDLPSLENGRNYLRYVSIEKGCNTFTYSDRSNIFVTGGSDKILRIWHPGIYTKPAGKLYGHIFSIVDVAINDADQHIISLSSARLVRIWDIHTLTALQVFGDNENRPGERRIHCILYDHKNEVLLTGSSVVDEWPIARKYHATLLVPQTHPYAVLLMSVNVQLGQLLTSDTTPQLRVWEIESGKLLAQLTDSHGPNVEVVAAAFDPTGYRMVSGGMNGSLRIWDFGSTQVLKGFDPFNPGDDKAVSDLYFYERPAIPGCNYVIALGWGGKIKIFRDSNSELELVELCDFADPNFKEDDMLFTPLIDDPVEARKSVLAKQQEEALMGPSPRKIVQRKASEDLNDDSRGLTFWREKSTLEDVLRGRFNQRLLLTEDRRVLITGTALGHLAAWDLRTQAIEIKWRLPASVFLEPHTAEPGVDRNAENIIPTPVSHTSMVNVTKSELHRVNAAIIVRPILPEKKKRYNAAGVELSSESDDDDDDEALSSTYDSEVDGPPVNDATSDAPENQRPRSLKTPTGSRKNSASSGMLYNQMTLLVSGHQDSWIRFWTMHKNPKSQNRVIHKTQMEISAFPSAVTCLCADNESKFLAAGDYKGYVCTWTMQLAVPSQFKSKVVKHGIGGTRNSATGASLTKLGQLASGAAPYFSLKFKVSWRAHNIKIEDIFYYAQHDILLTASMDSSVRIWKGFSAKYLGFFGQPQPFAFTGRYYGPLTQPVLPDIDDKPVFPMTSEKVLERKRAARKIRDLPLIVDRTRWDRPTSGNKDPSKKRFWQPKHVKDQYFNLLVKPKVQQTQISSSVNNNAVKRHGEKTGIYRSLITYGVSNTEHVNPRAIDFSIIDNGNNPMFKI